MTRAVPPSKYPEIFSPFLSTNVSAKTGNANADIKIPIIICLMVFIAPPKQTQDVAISIPHTGAETGPSDIN
jgi:hypothetical protein